MRAMSEKRGKSGRSGDRGGYDLDDTCALCGPHNAHMLEDEKILQLAEFGAMAAVFVVTSAFFPVVILLLPSFWFTFGSSLSPFWSIVTLILYFSLEVSGGETRSVEEETEPKNWFLFFSSSSLQLRYST